MPEDVAAPSPTKAGALGIITKKFGPLPVWAWVAVGAGAFLLWHKRTSKSTSQTAQPTGQASGAPSPDLAGYSNGQVGMDSSSLDSLQQQLASLQAQVGNQGIPQTGATPPGRMPPVKGNFDINNFSLQQQIQYFQQLQKLLTNEQQQLGSLGGTVVSGPRSGPIGISSGWGHGVATPLSASATSTQPAKTAISAS